jgi:nucleoside-diphosphate-sugar epimerase
LLPPWLSLGVGKPFCLPVAGSIATGASTVELLCSSGCKSLLTVPSILEEIALMQDNIGVKILKSLDFVAFGGGLPKESIGNMLSSAGVKLLNHYGSTETGPLAPFYVPSDEYDWHYFRLRKDIWELLKVQLDSASSETGSAQSWRLSLQPWGWTERFNLQDILISRPPSSTTEFCVVGRSDDLIRLSTGEKVRPGILELALVQDERVKAAVAFGDGQFEIGILVEPVHEIPEPEYVGFRDSMWAIIEKLNGQMDFHARVSSPHAVLITQPRSLPRSDKGTVLRREVYQRFEVEIAQIYAKLDSVTGSGFIFHLDSLEQDLRSVVQDSLQGKIRNEQWDDRSDFFELGMDSLEATKLRRRLVASRLEGDGEDQDRLSFQNIAHDFVYRHSSIAKMARAIRKANQREPGLEADEDDLSKWVDMYCLEARKEDKPNKVKFLLTGTTGSLGAHLLVHLVKMPNVDRIYCFNRPSQEDAFARQKKSLASKMLSISESDWCKVEIFQVNTSVPNLGLEQEAYARLVQDVTHIIHSSWPMNFKMRLPSFAGQFRVLRNLLALAKEISVQRSGLKPRVLFTSSISVVGHYGELYKESMVPEISIREPRSTISLGYAKAKLVCEQIIERSRAEVLGIETGYIRVGQIAGSQKGFWNADEHFVAIVVSSQKIGRLPDLKGVR